MCAGVSASSTCLCCTHTHTRLAICHTRMHLHDCVSTTVEYRFTFVCVCVGFFLMSAAILMVALQGGGTLVLRVVDALNTTFGFSMHFYACSV